MKTHMVTISIRMLFMILLLFLSFSCGKTSIYEVLSPCVINNEDTNNDQFTPCIKRAPLLNRSII